MHARRTSSGFDEGCDTRCLRALRSTSARTHAACAAYSSLGACVSFTYASCSAAEPGAAAAARVPAADHKLGDAARMNDGDGDAVTCASGLGGAAEEAARRGE